MEELFKLMRKNDIDTKIIDMFSIEYFTKEMINYIKNLRLEGHQLETMISLVSGGVFNRIDEKEYYKIIRMIKKSKSDEEDQIIINEIIINKPKYREKSM